MFFSAKNRSGRRRSDLRRAQLAAERLESRALMTVSPGTEFSRPAGFAAATEPTAYFDVETAFWSVPEGYTKGPGVEPVMFATSVLYVKMTKLTLWPTGSNWSTPVATSK